MRNVMITMIAFLMLSSFTAKAPSGSSPVNSTELSCYRMKSKIVSHTDYNFWVVTTQGALDNDFIADSCASPIDFEHQLLIGLKLETDLATYKITIQKIRAEDHAINIYFTSRRLKTSVEEGSPLELAAISKDPSIKKINFYHGEMLVRTVPIVSVY